MPKAQKEWTGNPPALLAPDFALPLARVTLLEKRAERLLWVDVLRMALEDVTSWRKPGIVMGWKRRAEILDAVMWFESRSNHIGSFHWLCAHLSISRSRVRKAIAPLIAEAAQAVERREKRARLVAVEKIEPEPVSAQ